MTFKINQNTDTTQGQEIQKELDHLHKNLINLDALSKSHPNLAILLQKSSPSIQNYLSTINIALLVFKSKNVQKINEFKPAFFNLVRRANAYTAIYVRMAEARISNPEFTVIIPESL